VQPAKLFARDLKSGSSQAPATKGRHFSAIRASWRPRRRTVTHAVTTEARRACIRALYGAIPDIMLAELRAMLSIEGIVVSVSTLWRFFARRGDTHRNRTAPTCGARVKRG